MMFLFFIFYIVMGILCAGVQNAIEEFCDGEEMLWAFLFWPVLFVILSVKGVTRIAKAFLREQK